jgi:hypothetical protein
MKRLAILMSCALAIAGCATTPTPEPSVRVIDTACDWVKPITASAADSYETKQQIYAHDLAYMKNCPQKKD